MKNYKKTVFIFLAACLVLLPVFSAFATGTPETKSTADSPYAKKYTITYLTRDVAPGDDSPIVKAIEDRFNVDFEFISVLSTELTDKL